MARTTGSDDLYRLIRSLSTEEKGYFKKFAKRHTSKGNKYLDLFDAINKQKEFTEADLKKKFKAYAVMKVYLFDMIMQCLLIYQGSSAPQTNLLRQMIYTHILQGKGLQNKAIQLTREALKIAEEKEFFWLEEAFFRNELIFSETRWSKGEHLEKYKQVMERLKGIRAKQANKDAYIWSGHYALHIKVGETFRGKTQPDVDSLVDRNFLENEEHVLSEGNKRYRLFALGRYYDTKGEHKKANGAFRDLLKIETSFFKTKHPLYSSVYHWLAIRALITSGFRIRDYEPIPALLKNMLEIAQYEKRYLKDTQYFTTLRQADYYWLTGRHTEGKRFLAAKLSTLFEREKENTDNIPDIIFLTRKILFDYSSGDYSRALMSVAHMQNLGARNDAPRLMADAEWTKLFIYLKTNDLNLARTTAINLEKRNAEVLSPREKQLLHLLNEINDKNRSRLLRSMAALKGDSPTFVFEIMTLEALLEDVTSTESFAQIIKRHSR